MISQDDVDRILSIQNEINTISEHIDCHYCRDHLQLVNTLLQDVKDISLFNVLYQDDPAMLNRYREIIQSERMLRVLALGSRVVGISRKLKGLFKTNRSIKNKA